MRRWPRFGRQLRFQADFPIAYSNLGNALGDQGRWDEAIAAYRQALVLKGDFAEAHCNLGKVLREKGELGEAVAACRRAIALKADFAEAHYNLGNALKDQGQVEEAIAAYRRAIALKGDFAEAHCNLGTALKDQGQINEALTSFRRAVAVRPDHQTGWSNLLFTLHYDPGCDAGTIVAEHRRWNQMHAEPLAAEIRPHPNDRSPERRVRIGYISPDFCAHVVGLNLMPLFRHHNRELFETYCYADALRPDGVTQMFQALSSGWRHCWAE